MFDSSTGFLLPDGSVRSPDASVVQLDRWQSLSPAQREGFPTLEPQIMQHASIVSGEPLLRDLQLDLEDIWAG